MTSKKIALWQVAAAVVLFQSDARAESAGYEAAYAELKSFIAPYTYVMTKPAYVYNWHSEAGDTNLNKRAEDPKAYQSFQAVVRRYWEKQEATQDGSVFGTGLYAALDPVASREFGGDGETWVLTQIKIPPGFRMVDVMRDGNMQLPYHLRSILPKLGCPEKLEKKPLLLSLLNPDEYKGYPKCAETIRRLFRDDLKIDGFSYQYNATQFKRCPSAKGSSGQFQQKSAFVVVNGQKLTPENVRVYNRLTENETEQRARIQSMFIRANVEDKSTTSFAAPTGSEVAQQLQGAGLSKYVPWTKNLVANSMSSYFSGNQIIPVVKSTICNQPSVAGGKKGNAAGQSASETEVSVGAPFQCVQVVWKRKGTKKIEEPVVLKNQEKYGEFLWPSLEGKPFTPKLTEWMEDNIYSCGQGDEYRPLFKPAKGVSVSDEEDDTEIVVGSPRTESAR